MLLNKNELNWGGDEGERQSQNRVSGTQLHYTPVVCNSANERKTWVCYHKWMNAVNILLSSGAYRLTVIMTKIIF